MSLFSDDLGERLLSSLNSTGKDSLNDLGQDQDEQDKIILNASKSVQPIELRVDYSDFQNHIFFNSAYTSVNLAYSRIFNDYPSDGTYKDYFEWRRINNGYENWFFDNFPKQQGYILLNSGSNGPSVYLKDYENKLNFLSTTTSSVSFEFIAKPYENLQTLNPVCSVLNDGGDSGYLVYFENKNSTKWLTVKAADSGSVHTFYVSASCDNLLSSSNHFAVTTHTNVADSTLTISIFANAVLQNTGTTGAVFNSINANQPNVRVGYHQSGTVACYFSGALDEFKFWNSDRTSFLAKNYFKPIFANPSGGLKIYYRFNELDSYGNKIIDYSGNELHGAFSGNYSLTTNRVSGTLGSWFKESGDPIFDSANSRVVDFFTTQQNSGSLFDQTNRNYIFNIVPAFFVDSEDADNQKLFLLLLARHYDKLKLYIEHLSNIHNLSLDSSNDAPDKLMNLVAQNYGVDIGDVYDSSDPLSLYFGEGVLGSGSLDSSVEVVKNQLKRNVLNNLIYFLKTKSTRESIESILYSLGVDTDVVNINEYSLFSGGIETNRRPTVSECRVANFNTASVINISLSGTNINSNNLLHQVRFLFSSGTTSLTSSIFTFESGSTLRFGVRAERENATSPSGTLKLTFLDSGSVYRTISSSLLPLYNGSWNSLAVSQELSGGGAVLSGTGFFISQLDYDTLINSQSVITSSVMKTISSLSEVNIYLGTSGSNYFSGNMQEYRLWKNHSISGNLDLIKRWHYDYESTEYQSFNNNSDNFQLRYRLNDFTSSATTSGVVHDFVNGFTSSYSNFTTSSYYNFPGMFIPRYVQSYSYDINTNNNKIRLRDQGRKLRPNEQTKDVPMVTVDVSPIVSQNKEIIKYLGDLRVFNDIAGQPYNKYRDQVKAFNQYKSTFFDQKVNNKIDFKAYINLIKWLDSNFTTLLNQFIPLDMISSISNFTIEPGLFDYSKVKYEFPYRVNGAPTVLSSSMTLTSRMSATSVISLLPADPGRFGSAVSASAYQPSSFNFSSTYSGSNGVNYNNSAQKAIISLSMSTDYSHIGISSSYYSGSNNSFYMKAISSSNYLRDVLGVNTDFYLSASKIQYDLSSTAAPLASVFYTGTLNSVQDQRWMWFRIQGTASGYDMGIGYGGGWGQLSRNSGKSSLSPGDKDHAGSGKAFVSRVNIPSKQNIRHFREEDSDRKVAILWPTENDYNGVNIFSSSANAALFADGSPAASFGTVVDIAGYKSLTIEILGNYSKTATELGGPSKNVPLNSYYLIQFQFFDDQNAEGGFETLSSGSYTTQAQPGQSFYLTEQLPHIVALYAPNTTTFHLPYVRPIPNNKFMRIFLTPSLAGGTSSNYVNILVKGILSKTELSTIDIYKARSI